MLIQHSCSPKRMFAKMRKDKSEEPNIEMNDSPQISGQEKKRKDNENYLAYLRQPARVDMQKIFLQENI